jgi:hypothetical protein
MQDGLYFAFYHTRSLAKALTVLKRALEQRNLLEHSVLFYIEAENSGLRIVHPPTAEIVLPSPWNT